MKYIHYKAGDVEDVICFSDRETHSNNRDELEKELGAINVLAAGFFSYNWDSKEYSCFGNSVSLDVYPTQEEHERAAKYLSEC